MDRNDYHQFQPLLYQVASSQLPAEDIARPHRAIFKDLARPSAVVNAAVTAVDLLTRTLDPRRWHDLDGLPSGHGRRCPAELLRRPRRSRARASRCTRWPTPNGCGCTCSGCCRTRWASSPSSRDPGDLDVVVVGGGPTGVETTGALAELMRRPPPDGRLDAPGQITLVDRGAPCSDSSPIKAHGLRPGEADQGGCRASGSVLAVTAVHSDRVELDDGTTISTRTVVWGGGESGAPIARDAVPAPGRGGRIDVRPDLTVPGFPGAYAVGDVANIPSGDDRGTRRFHSWGRWRSSRADGPR